MWFRPNNLINLWGDAEKFAHNWLHTLIPRDFDRPRYFVAFLTDIFNGVFCNICWLKSFGSVGDGSNMVDDDACRLLSVSSCLAALLLRLFIEKFELSSLLDELISLFIFSVGVLGQIQLGSYFWIPIEVRDTESELDNEWVSYVGRFQTFLFKTK